MGQKKEAPMSKTPNTQVKPSPGSPAARAARRAREEARAAARVAATPQPEQIIIRPLAAPAQVKQRHWGLLFSFLVMMVLPLGTATWYLYTKAADQYASVLGFTVRSEDVSSASDLLGGLGASLGGSTSRDADILYEFVLSSDIVSKIDAQLDLNSQYSIHHANDPLLSYDPAGTIEDLTAFWRRMVRVSYDAGSGLMELRVLAFRPEDAQAIASAILEESTTTINDLSAIAREDATRYAQQDLDFAFDRVKSTREALTTFRLANEIVDPNADIQAKMGLLNTLQAQQAEALIEFDLISDTARESDPRLDLARRRIDVIDARITEERQKFGAGGRGAGGENYATTIADFERLTIEREFAELGYATALSTLDAAKAEANRQSRYLAAYIKPTLAQKSEFPQRLIILGVIGLFAFLIWAILSLVYYSLRDRR